MSENGLSAEHRMKMSRIDPRYFIFHAFWPENYLSQNLIPLGSIRQVN